jgi:hypothetical protein
LRDANGKPADNLKKRGGGMSWTPRDSDWVTVPADGVLRLRANRNMATIELVRTEHPNLVLKQARKERDEAPSPNSSDFASGISSLDL